jgi:hypothetical protein
MALTVGTNSYLSRADADTYFSTHLLSDVWASFSDSQKDSGLVSATSQIDNTCTFIGFGISAAQALAWPRDGAEYLDPRTGRLTSPNEEPGGVPTRVTRATAELALHLLQNKSAYSGGEPTFDFIKVGPIELENSRGTSTDVAAMPPSVHSYLAPLLYRGKGNTWWRAN